MTDQLVQISRRDGRIDRVPRGQTPVIDLRLAPGQYVANVELEDRLRYDRLDRKTTDWRWTAYIVTPLGGPTDG